MESKILVIQHVYTGSNRRAEIKRPRFHVMIEANMALSYFIFVTAKGIPTQRQRHLYFGNQTTNIFIYLTWEMEIRHNYEVRIKIDIIFIKIENLIHLYHLNYVHVVDGMKEISFNVKKTFQWITLNFTLIINIFIRIIYIPIFTFMGIFNRIVTIH